VRAIQATLAAMRLSRRGRLLALARARGISSRSPCSNKRKTSPAMKPKRKVPDRKTSRRRRPAVRTIDQLSPLIHKFATEPDPGKAARIEKQILRDITGGRSQT